MNNPIAVDVVKAEEDLVREAQSGAGVDWVGLLLQEGEQVVRAVFKHDCHRGFF